MDSNGAANETQPVTIVDDPYQEPNTGKVAKLDGGIESETTEETTETQTTVFFVESVRRSIAGTEEGTLLETSSSEPSPAGNVGETDAGSFVEEVQHNQEPNVGGSFASEANTTAEDTYPRIRYTDQMSTISHSPKNVGFHEMFTSLVNVFAGSESQVNNPIPVSVNSQTQRTASRFFLAEDSDEDSDSLEDDISDEMLPPMPVLLAQVKQFVQAKTRAGNSPARSSLIQQDHSILAVGSASEEHVVGRNADSDEEDHSNEQDMSLEVDIDLLPEIRRYLKPNVGNREATGHIQTLFSQDNEDPGSSLLETKDILENPAFQQMIRKIDNRLKRTSGARGKRLMEKYAEALAVYPSLSLNTASTSTTFYGLLPFFITCLLVSLS